MKSELRIKDWEEVNEDTGISKLRQFRETMDKMFTDFHENTKTPVRDF